MDATRIFKEGLYHNPIYVHSHLKSFEANILQLETFKASLNEINDSVKTRMNTLITIFENEANKYRKEGFDLKELIVDDEQFRKECESFIGLKKSFSNLGVKAEKINPKAIKFDEKWTLEEFMEQNKYPLRKYEEGKALAFEEVFHKSNVSMTVDKWVTDRLLHIQSISDVDNAGKITKVRQRQKGSTYIPFKKLENQDGVTSKKLQELGIVNQKIAAKILDVLRIYSIPHREAVVSNIDKKYDEFLGLVNNMGMIDGKLDLTVGNFEKNRALIQSRFTKESFNAEKLSGTRFRTTLFNIIYSSLGYYFEDIVANTIARKTLETLEVKASADTLFLTTQEEQDTNVADVVLRDLSSKSSSILRRGNPLGISVKSNLQGQFYGSKNFGEEMKNSKNKKLLGGLTIAQILYFLVNYEVLRKFSVIKYEPDKSQEIRNEGTSPAWRVLDPMFEELAYVLQNITTILGLIGSLFASLPVDKIGSGSITTLDDTIALPLVILFPNGVAYAHDILRAVKDYQFGIFGATFSLRNKALLVKDPGSLWDKKREIIEDLIRTKNHRGYEVIKEKLGSNLNITDDVPLTVYFSMNITNQLSKF